jgi:hypothetical protein
MNQHDMLSMFRQQGRLKVEWMYHGCASPCFCSTRSNSNRLIRVLSAEPKKVLLRPYARNGKHILYEIIPAREDFRFEMSADEYQKDVSKFVLLAAGQG